MSLLLDIDQRRGDFHLEVRVETASRSVLGIVGPSGAGKSTLLNVVAGIERPQRGRIVLDERVIVATASGDWVPAARRGFGYLPQAPLLFPHLDVRGNLLFGWQRGGAQRQGPAEPEEVISLLQLEPLLARRPATLSGGEAQRVALGRALLTNPALLLLDEPLTALDWVRRDEILHFLSELKVRYAIPMLVVSHNMDEIVQLADEVLVLDAGKAVACGDLFDVSTDLELATYTGNLAAGGVIAATVKTQSEDITELAFSGGTLSVPALAEAPGRVVRVRVLARDVMLSLNPVEGISANNVVAATITAIRGIDSAQVLVQLDLGGTKLLALITRQSLRRLNLETGMAVYALIKSVSVDLGRAHKMVEND
jgi:molybdate transport system ATP-binding protein